METPRDQFLAEVRSCGKVEVFARMSGAKAHYDHETHVLTVEQGKWGPFKVSGEGVHLLVEAVGLAEAWRILREDSTPPAGDRLQFSESTVQLLGRVHGSREVPDA